MDLLIETVLLKTKSTLFNLLIRETPHFPCYEGLLNITYVAYKNAFFREMQFWSHCFTVVSYQALFRLYQYTKFQPYTFRVQKKYVFARYATLVPRLLCVILMKKRGIFSDCFVESFHICKTLNVFHVE